MKRRTFLGLCSLALIGGRAIGAEKKKEKEKKGKGKKDPRPEASGIDPHGTPKNFDGNKLGIWVWREGQTWRISTTTKGRQRDFSGTVKIIGGTFAKPVSAAKMEVGEDWGLVNYGKAELAFKMKTRPEGRDNFCFTVTPGTRKVEFDLNIEDQKEMANAIFVGESGQHPPSRHFVVPAE